MRPAPLHVAELRVQGSSVTPRRGIASEGVTCGSKSLAHQRVSTIREENDTPRRHTISSQVVFNSIPAVPLVQGQQRATRRHPPEVSEERTAPIARQILEHKACWPASPRTRVSLLREPAPRQWRTSSMSSLSSNDEGGASFGSHYTSSGGASFGSHYTSSSSCSASTAPELKLSLPIPATPRRPALSGSASFRAAAHAPPPP
ncbi:hypothetical protein T484DRAFT_1876302, partial [Baffinella frigidus]